MECIATITAKVDDSIDAADVPVTVTLTPSGSANEYQSSATVQIISEDDDTAGINIVSTYNSKKGQHNNPPIR